MQAEIIDVKQRQINICGENIGLFQRGSSWNGMTEYKAQNGDGTIILMDEDKRPFDFFFNYIASNVWL